MVIARDETLETPAAREHALPQFETVGPHILPDSIPDRLQDVLSPNLYLSMFWRPATEHDAG